MRSNDKAADFQKVNLQLSSSDYYFQLYKKYFMLVDMCMFPRGNVFKFRLILLRMDCNSEAASQSCTTGPDMLQLCKQDHSIS